LRCRVHALRPPETLVDMIVLQCRTLTDGVVFIMCLHLAICVCCRRKCDKT
jgi:hypothetical protein